MTRNPTGWKEVHDTVRFWQDVLMRLWLAGKHQERLEYAEKALKQVSHSVDMSPPQTLGELCISMFDSRVVEWRTQYDFFWPFCYLDAGKFTDDSKFIVYSIPNSKTRRFLQCSRRNINALRRSMYRRDTDDDWVCSHGYHHIFPRGVPGLAWTP